MAFQKLSADCIKLHLSTYPLTVLSCRLQSRISLGCLGVLCLVASSECISFDGFCRSGSWAGFLLCYLPKCVLFLLRCVHVQQFVDRMKSECPVRWLYHPWFWCGFTRSLQRKKWKSVMAIVWEIPSPWIIGKQASEWASMTFRLVVDVGIAQYMAIPLRNIDPVVLILLRAYNLVSRIAAIWMSLFSINLRISRSPSQLNWRILRGVPVISGWLVVKEGLTGWCLNLNKCLLSFY